MAAALSVSPLEDMPVTWLTPVRPSRGTVIEHTCQVIVNLILTCWGFGTRQASKEVVASLRGVVRRAYYCQPQEEGKGIAHGIPSDLAKQCPVRRFHVTTLDKRPADCRVACPTLTVQEIERDLRKYFEPVARCDSELVEKVVRDWETEFSSLLEHEDIDGAVLEETDFQTVRALPKGKSPGKKSRLVVGCHRLATTKIHKWATRGVEAVLDMCRRNGQAKAECNVSSVGQVHEALDQLANTIFKEDGGTVLSIGKFDFTNFFMEVDRTCVMSALSFWTERTKAASGRRKLLRVKKTQEWKRNRTPTGRWEARG